MTDKNAKHKLSMQKNERKKERKQKQKSFWKKK